MSEVKPGNGYNALKGEVEELEEELEEARDLLAAVERGVDLARYEYYHRDAEYVYYCSDCNRQIGEERKVSNIPRAQHARCWECRRTPEEKAQLEQMKEVKQAAADMLKLAELKKKYPDLEDRLRTIEI